METVVLVLTDVQGSTRLWQDESAAMDAAMARHHEIVHGAVAAHEGWRPVDQGEGDAVFAAFRSASKAVEAVAQVQRELAAEPWPTSIPLKVRIGVHVGEVTERAGNLYGDPVNRCARLRGLGAGGQTLLSAPVYELVRDNLPTGASVTDLGEHRMKDLTRPEHVWQLDLGGLPGDFPPLASLDRVLHNLPVQPSTLIGRERELAAVLAALDASRLVTLTGFGGMGKTRLAMQAAAELADGDGDGVWFVDLAGTIEPAAVPGLIGRATGLGGTDADSVIDGMTGQRLLLVLDNLEQVLGCAPFIGELLARVPGTKVLATSREPLRLRGEKELALMPLALPPEDGPQDAASLSTYAAVQLFVERAVAVKASFEVTNDNAPAVAAICQRLDGHPLAIELAAARVRMMSPQALLPKLDQALSVLTGGGRDLPDRQQTLRATIAWSYDLLEPEDQLLLDRLSVFAGPIGFDLVEAVCGQDLDVFSALASLVEKSLVRTSLSEDGEDRYGLLVSIKAYAAERLGAAAELRDRHADVMMDQAQLRAPYTAQESKACNERVRSMYDELTAAWQHVQACADDQRIVAFPADYFGEVFDRTEDTSGLDTVIAASSTASPNVFMCLEWRMYARVEAYEDYPATLHGQLHAMAGELDCPEARFYALIWEQRHTLDPEERRARVAALDALLELTPSDSPWGRDALLALRDNQVGLLLQFIEPEAQLAADERLVAGPLSSAIHRANLANSCLWLGQWDKVLDVTRSAVDGGVTRIDPNYTHMSVTLAARALVELGRPQEALDVLQPWADWLSVRGWKAAKELNACSRAYALHTLGRAQEAAELVAALPRPFAVPATRIMALRAERLTGGDVDPLVAAEVAQELEEKRWMWLPFFLAALVEQALRETSEDACRSLLHRIAEYPTPVVLAHGYQADLERLRAEH